MKTFKYFVSCKLCFLKWGQYSWNFTHLSENDDRRRLCRQSSDYLQNHIKWITQALSWYNDSIFQTNRYPLKNQSHSATIHLRWIRPSNTRLSTLVNCLRVSAVRTSPAFILLFFSLLYIFFFFLFARHSSSYSRLFIRQLIFHAASSQRIDSKPTKPAIKSSTLPRTSSQGNRESRAKPLLQFLRLLPSADIKSWTAPN